MIQIIYRKYRENIGKYNSYAIQFFCTYIIFLFAFYNNHLLNYNNHLLNYLTKQLTQKKFQYYVNCRILDTQGEKNCRRT